MNARRDWLPSSMFSNRFEVAAFWACLAGLALVLVIAVVRPVSRRVETQSVADVQQDLAHLESLNADQALEIARLQVALRTAQTRIDSLITR